MDSLTLDADANHVFVELKESAFSEEIITEITPASKP